MTFAGIDVSKPHLDLALVSNSPKPTRLRFPNTPEGRQALLAALPEAEVLMALPGVGPQVAAAVLALLPPELWGRAKAAASYAGLIPEREESGKSVERGRLSRKGPPLLRRKLYMGALVAVRHDPEMRAFYHRLLSRGKTKKQALLAVAHKLLRRMMGRLREYYAGQPAQGVA
ncbi:Transposase IS116/IS110/IS902 family protein [Thermus arciformis]|uniref:Transposase IS116/IS110/IS902 family protein n=1 Tax=Thermus arciformis TaxID=482827 RepID=A0A1G7GCF6_9DEIN|nr:transposase [Thermus arciformis]SDE85832.1 Transposase IS116/IS110/IS902 family protein [Thermus arciformis]